MDSTTEFFSRWGGPPRGLSSEVSSLAAGFEGADRKPKRLVEGGYGERGCAAAMGAPQSSVRMASHGARGKLGPAEPGGPIFVQWAIEEPAANFRHAGTELGVIDVLKGEREIRPWHGYAKRRGIAEIGKLRCDPSHRMACRFSSWRQTCRLP